MVTKDEIIAKAKNAILNYDVNMAKEASKEALSAGLGPLEVIEQGFTPALQEVGTLFENGKLSVSQMIFASQAMNAGMAVLKPEIEKEKAAPVLGKVLIGTVEGDLHSIGKDLVALMLEVAGFRVLDLGRDVAVEEFVEKAKTFKPDILASSALMKNTMLSQVLLEDGLRKAGIRSQLKTMVGGAPVTQEWARQIGADIYAENAAEAVSKAKASLACLAQL